MSISFNSTGTQRTQRSTTPDYNSPYTLLLWVQVDDYSAAHLVYKIKIDDSNYDQAYISSVSHKFHCNGVRAGTDQHQGDSDYATSVGTWAPYAIVRTSATELRQYTGATPTALVETIHSGTTIAGRSAANSLTFGSSGSDGDGLGLSGRVAFARIFPFALTAAQIAVELQHAQPILGGSWGSWRMGAATEIGDDSGNARPLTLNGSPPSSSLQPPVRVYSVGPNLLDETFEGQGYKAMTGAATVSGTSILDPDLSTALIANPSTGYPGSQISNTPPGWGDQCLRCVSQGVNTEIRKQHDLPSPATGRLYFRDEIYVHSESIADADESTFFTAWNLAFTVNLFHIKLRRDNPSLRIQFVLNDNGTSVIVSSGDITAIVPRKYSCEVMFDMVTHQYECRIDGVTVGSGTLSVGGQTQFQTLVVGNCIFDTTGPTVTIYHDNVGISNQDWIGPSRPTITRVESAVRRPIVIDTFSRSLTGAGAGTAEGGLDPRKLWTTISGSDTDVDVDGTALIFRPDTGFWVGIIGSLSQAPIVELEIEVSNYGPSTSLFREISVYPRIYDMSTFYECRYNNDQNLLDTGFLGQIVKNAAGTAATMKQGPTGGSTRLSAFKLKGRAENTPYGVILRIKFWSIYAQEPDWLFSVLDDTPTRMEGGYIGLKIRNHSASDTRIESFQAYSYENPSAAPALFLGDHA